MTGTKAKPDAVVKITNGTVVTESETIPKGTVIISDGKITFVGKSQDEPRNLPDSIETFDARGGWICPGLIDVHIHGGGGADAMAGTEDALETIAQTHGTHGTTGFLVTTTTESYDKILATASTVRKIVDRAAQDNAQPPRGARVLGMHLEGPYINPKRLGAQNPKYVRTMNVDEFGQIYDILGDAFKLTTIAPELPSGHDVIAFLTERNIVPSIGHTEATYEEAVASFEAGVKHATHMYNAMTPLHHRNPGVVGAALLSERVVCEVIADGVHLHPAATRLVWKTKGTSRTCVITDAMAAAGMPDGAYELGGLAVNVKDGACRLEDGTLAGSILTMDKAIGHLVQDVGIPIVEAVRMASLTPATVIQIDDTKGSLSVGKDADITVLSAEFDAVATWVEGHRI